MTKKECLSFVSFPRSVSHLWVAPGVFLLCERPKERLSFVSTPRSVSPLWAIPVVSLLCKLPQECLSFESDPRSVSHLWAHPGVFPLWVTPVVSLLSDMHLYNPGWYLTFHIISAKQLSVNLTAQYFTMSGTLIYIVGGFGRGIN